MRHLSQIKFITEVVVEYIIISAFFIFLLIITFYLPISMSKFSKVIVCSVGFVLSLLNMLFFSFLLLWQFILVSFLLLGVAAYFLIKYLPLPEGNDDTNSTNNLNFLKKEQEEFPIKKDNVPNEIDTTYYLEQMKNDELKRNQSNSNSFKKDELY